MHKNYSQARAWFEKAAGAGVAMAMFNLGRLYNDGNGVQLNSEEARAWYQKAAAAGIWSGRLVRMEPCRRIVEIFLPQSQHEIEIAVARSGLRNKCVVVLDGTPVIEKTPFWDTQEFSFPVIDAQDEYLTTVSFGLVSRESWQLEACRVVSRGSVLYADDWTGRILDSMKTNNLLRADPQN